MRRGAICMLCQDTERFTVATSNFYYVPPTGTAEYWQMLNWFEGC